MFQMKSAINDYENSTRDKNSHQISSNNNYTTSNERIQRLSSASLGIERLQNYGGGGQRSTDSYNTSQYLSTGGYIAGGGGANNT